MKKSTILIAGTLALVGVGAYVYLKGKKSTTPIGSPTSTNTTSGTSSAVDSSLGLSATTQAPAKATIDNVVSAFAETQTENYKKAKVISKEIEVLTNTLRGLESDYKRAISAPLKILPMGAGFSNNGSGMIQLNIQSTKKNMSEKTAQANALGYKILPYGEIEKM